MEKVAEYRRPVTQKGTVTIPVEIRRLLGVKPRGKVTFRVIGGKRVELPPTLSLAATFGSVRPKRRPWISREYAMRRSRNTFKKTSRK